MRIVALSGMALVAGMIAAATPSSAAVIDVSSGFATFGGSRSVTGTGFTDTFTFDTTGTGFTYISGQAGSYWLRDPFDDTVTADLDFVSLILNGTVLFNARPGNNDVVENYSLPSQMLAEGLNTLIVTYNVDTALSPAGYSGTLTLGTTSDVPEAATWAMFIGGFGAVGASLRRKRSTTVAFG